MGTRAKSAILSLLIAFVLALAWHIGTLPKAAQASGVDPEYAKLMGLDKPKSDGLPTLAQQSHDPTAYSSRGSSN